MEYFIIYSKFFQFSFPSFQILALGQLVVTLVGFQIANLFSLIKLPEINLNYSKKAIIFFYYLK